MYMLQPWKGLISGLMFSVWVVCGRELVVQRFMKTIKFLSLYMCCAGNEWNEPPHFKSFFILVIMYRDDVFFLVLHSFTLMSAYMLL